MSEKPRLSFWQLWNMSFGFFGIQFGGVCLLVAAFATLLVRDSGRETSTA